jgi:ABC-2 type transport system permease protein
VTTTRPVATRPPAPEPPAAGPQLFAGTGSLLRFALRRDRRRLIIGVLALGLLPVYTAVALGTIYPTPADRQGRAALIANPAGVLLSGPGYGLDHYTLGAMITNELTFSVLVAAAIMSIQLVVRQTRAEEESGRAELVRAAVVGRRAPLTAALLEAALADAVLVVVITAGLAGSGLAPADSLAMATGIGLTGLLFGAVAAVTAQLSAHARAASGAALAVLALAAVVRGVGDIVRLHGSALSWFSPIAWAQQTRPFVDLRWEPLLLSVAVVVGLAVLAYRLVAVRDVGAGLVAPRRGPAGAGGSLSSVAGLALRLQRASVIGWAVALLLTGAVFGSLADQVAGMVAGNARLREVVGAGIAHDLMHGFLSAAAQYVGVAAGAFAVASVLRAQAEEAGGRTEVVLAAAVGRHRYLGEALGVTVGASAALLLIAGLGTGLAAAAVLGDGGLVLAQAGAQLVRLPAVLVLAGVAVALFGAAPRLGGLAWLPVTWAVVVVAFGPLLSLPGWAQKLSPFGWLPRVPDEPVAWAPLLGLTAVAAVLVAVGLVGFRRRDAAA